MALRRIGGRGGGGRTGGVTAPVAPARRVPWRHGITALRIRRLVGAVLLAAAAGTAVEALLPEDDVRTPSVLAAATDLPAGHVLAADDLVPVALPDDLVPAGALDPSHADGVAGRRLAGPVGAGEVVTGVRLAGRGLLAGQPAGTVALAVPVLPASADLVRPGDDVAVLTSATDPLTGALLSPDDPATRGATVGDLTAPGAPAPRAVVLDVPAAAAAGALGGVGASAGDGVVVLAVSATDAQQLAQAAAGGPPVVLAVLP
ncbi:SAF domain-containing protein [Pseudokineococcus basanitobsidens]|uniref:SAF domain-containing protein n=1 Tax=Pseudokineococcus basanitobsidens TaxID=1926649 RepID=A0ABU8RP34_9ACTN